MRRPIPLTALLALAFAAPPAAEAQIQLTLTVPLQLTDLHSDIGQVQLLCEVGSLYTSDDVGQARVYTATPTFNPYAPVPSGGMTIRVHGSTFSQNITLPPATIADPSTVNAYRCPVRYVAADGSGDFPRVDHTDARFRLAPESAQISMPMSGGGTRMVGGIEGIIEW